MVGLLQARLPELGLDEVPDPRARERRWSLAQILRATLPPSRVPWRCSECGAAGWDSKGRRNVPIQSQSGAVAYVNKAETSPPTRQ